MAKRKIGLIKADFFNMRIEFSPNINIISKKSQSITGGDDIEEVILSFEIVSEKMGKPKYKTYVLGSDEVEDDEPFDEDNPWYMDESGEPVKSKPASSPKPTPPPAKAATPAPAPAPATTAPAPTPAATAPAPTAAATAAESEVETKLIQLEAQLASIQKMVETLDSSFQAGNVNQEEFLKKKNFLAQKMGTLMGQIDNLKS